MKRRMHRDKRRFELTPNRLAAYQRVSGGITGAMDMGDMLPCYLANPSVLSEMRAWKSFA